MGARALPQPEDPALAYELDAGRNVDRLAVPIAAWIAFVRRKAQAHEPIVDQLADVLAKAAAGSDVATAMLALRQVFPERLAADPRFRHAVTGALLPFLDGHPETLLAR